MEQKNEHNRTVSWLVPSLIYVCSIHWGISWLLGLNLWHSFPNYVGRKKDLKMGFNVWRYLSCPALNMSFHSISISTSASLTFSLTVRTTVPGWADKHTSRNSADTEPRRHKNWEGFTLPLSLLACVPEYWLRLLRGLSLFVWVGKVEIL